MIASCCHPALKPPAVGSEAQMHLAILFHTPCVSSRAGLLFSVGNVLCPTSNTQALSPSKVQLRYLGFPEGLTIPDPNPHPLNKTATCPATHTYASPVLATPVNPHAVLIWSPPPHRALGTGTPRSVLPLHACPWHLLSTQHKVTVKKGTQPSLPLTVPPLHSCAHMGPCP